MGAVGSTGWQQLREWVVHAGVLAVSSQLSWLCVPQAGSHHSSISCPFGCHSLAAGTAEGSLVLFAPDPRRRITRRFNLAA